MQVSRSIASCLRATRLRRLPVPRRPKSDGVVWLAVDRGGVALIAARTGELMYSHAFDWDSSVGATGSQAHLLHRYSLVSFLAPAGPARDGRSSKEKGRRVEAIVTCGTLPDLRSLTMPLIEELDTEVETLDSLDGLIVKDSAKGRLSGHGGGDSHRVRRRDCQADALVAHRAGDGGRIHRVASAGCDRSWRRGAGGCVVPDFETATRSTKLAAAVRERHDEPARAASGAGIAAGRPDPRPDRRAHAWGQTQPVPVPPPGSAPVQQVMPSDVPEPKPGRAWGQTPTGDRSHPRRSPCCPRPLVPISPVRSL